MSFKFVGETLLPGISENLLASFLALIGGPIPSLAYRGMLHGFEWISPILPRLEWTVAAFLGTIVPALGLIILRMSLKNVSQGDEQSVQEEAISTPWIVVAVTAVAMLWFNTGMFGVRPTMVSGVSMKPALIVGDLVVTREVDPETIQIGDIIQYRRAGSFILHRVVDISRGSDGLVFITRGDANNVDDDPVHETAVEGKIVLVIPKLGWIGILPRLMVERMGGLP